MVAVTRRLLADRGHLAADAVEVRDGVCTIDASTTKGQMLESEGCTFRVGDIVRILRVPHGRVLAGSARRRQLALDLLEELLQVRWHDRARLDERRLESVHAVSEVREVLRRRIVRS